MSKNLVSKFQKLIDKSKNLVSAKTVKITEAEKLSKNLVSKFRKHTPKFRNHAPKFSNLVPFIPILALTLTTALVVTHLRTLPTKASVTTPVSVTVPSSCSFSADADTHSATITSGLLEELDGITLTSICNGAYDSQILAVGFTNDTEGNTTLSSVPDTVNTLDNCSALSPSSCWSMKVTGLDTDTYPFTPQNNYDTYKSIPEKETLIAKTELKTEANPKSTLKTTYNIYTTATQPAGTYTGKVKYTLATEPSNLKIYIQDLTLDDCKVNVGANGNAANIGDNITVYDKRDENDYTVRYINGYCWMTQNLRTVGAVTSAQSNFSASSFNISQYDLTNTTYCNSGSSASSPIGYTNVCYHDSGDASTGVWYNFAAASAGTITGYQNSAAAAQDICPLNWHLPTGPNTTSDTDFNKLVGNTTSGRQAATAGLTAFGGVAGGPYINGSLEGTGYGYWWSASAGRNYYRYYLLYDSGNGQFCGDISGVARYMGFFIRCVRTS